jgi:hypothetical protein
MEVIVKISANKDTGKYFDSIIEDLKKKPSKT